MKETFSKFNICGTFYIPKGNVSGGGQRRRKNIVSQKRRLYEP